MNNKPILILIIILVLAGLGIYFATGKSAEKEAMMEKEGEIMEKEEMVEGDEKMIENEAMMEKGSYETYSPEKLAKAEDGKVVLFFHAAWCPTCRALESNLNSNLKNLPGDLTILKVDYDNSTSLKQKYGVTTQHTLVQVDASGNQIAKWQGSPNLTDIVSKLK